MWKQHGHFETIEVCCLFKTTCPSVPWTHIVLRSYSEEIFDYSAEQMTQLKTTNLRNQMNGEFSEIFKLCKEVLDRANKPSLIKATLETLLRFLNWIPLGYIFETNLIDILRNRVSELIHNQL